MRYGLVILLALSWWGVAHGKAFKAELKTADADFTYSWSTEAAAIPDLVKRFSKDMRERRAATVSGGKEFNALRKEAGDEPSGFMHATDVSTAGQSSTLLSLEISTASYMGGAHGNYGYSSLLWDRRANREIKFGDLFLRPNGFATLTRPAYCKALDAERLRRREGERYDGEFGQCPPYSDLAIAPVDKDGDGRFERINLVAAPYTAGPFSEGDYTLELPVTRQLMATMKPVYRASFDPQRQ